MPDNEVLKKLKEAVEAQQRVQAAAKAIKAELERTRIIEAQ